MTSIRIASNRILRQQGRANGIINFSWNSQSCEMLAYYLVLLFTFIEAFICNAELALNFEIILKESDRSFLQWFQRNGGSISNIAIQDFPLMGRGIITSNNLKDGDEVMHIPSSVIITRDFVNNSNDSIHKKLSQYIQSEDSIIATFLLYERFKGEASIFYPYIRVLPDYIPNLSYFSLENINELQNDILQQSAIQSQQDIKVKFEEFIKSCPLLWSTCSTLSIDDYNWAMSVVDSRGLRFKGKIHLVPLADMFNYAPHSNYRASQSGDFFLNYHKLQPNGSIIIYADRDCEAGRQLFEDYGDNDDNVYLQYHGFTPYENPFRCIQVTAPPISSLSQLQQELAAALQFKTSPSQCITESLNFNLPMQIYLSMLSFSEKESNHCIQTIKNGRKLKQKWSIISKECGFDHIIFPISLPVEENNNSTIAVISVIKSWLSINKPLFNTTIEEDENILHQLELQLQHPKDAASKRNLQHRSLAVTYRINMKKLWIKIYSQFMIDSSFISSTGNNTNISRECSTSGDSSDVKCTKIFTESQLGSNDYISISNNNNNTTSSSTTTGSLPDNNHNNKSSNTVAIDTKLKLLLFNNWYNNATHNNTNINTISKKRNKKVEGGLDSPPNKLQIQQIPGFRLGTTATAPISAEEIYLSVPVNIIIDHDKAYTDIDFNPLLVALHEKYRNSDQYQELLLYLLHQYFIQKNNSFYWPYLQLLPTLQELDIPLLWSAEQRKDRISPSHLLQEVELYRTRCEKIFAFIRSVDIITNFFPEDILSLDNYLWATAILDSRAIWWGGKRHLVPLLDMINCGEGPDTSRVHSTVLDATGKYAVTKAGWEFQTGDQVFENYGQPNHVYYVYHGFTLVNNSHDCLMSDFSATEHDLHGIDESKLKLLEKLLRMPKRAFVQDAVGGGGGAMICLKSPLNVTYTDSTLWILLAIKLQKVSILLEKKQLGKPFMEGVQYLHQSLSLRRDAHSSKLLPQKDASSNTGRDDVTQENNPDRKIADNDNHSIKYTTNSNTESHLASLQFLTTELHLLTLLSSQSLILLNEFKAKLTTDQRGMEVTNEFVEKNLKVEL